MYNDIFLLKEDRINKSIKEVYHFTTFENAQKIYNHRKNFVDSFILNHKRWDKFENENIEGEEFIRILDIASNKLLVEGKIDKKFYDRVSYKARSKTLNTYIVTSNDNVRFNFVKEECTAFIACFSTDGNNKKNACKFMKNSDYGISLGFSSIDINEVANKGFGNGYEHLLFNVIYDDTRKLKITEDALLKLFMAFNEKNFDYFLTNFIISTKFLFKDKTLQHEKEIRSLVIHKYNYTIDTIPIVFDFQTFIGSFAFIKKEICDSDKDYINSLKSAPFHILKIDN